MFLFEKLNVYQRALSFTDKITSLTDQFTRGNGYITNQLQRAALSILLNIAEGNGRHHLKDKCNFFWIARGSAYECVPILELCLRKGLIKKEDHFSLRQDIVILQR